MTLALQIIAVLLNLWGNPAPQKADAQPVAVEQPAPPAGTHHG